jgi:hypothetical protein
MTKRPMSELPSEDDTDDATPALFTITPFTQDDASDSEDLSPEEVAAAFAEFKARKKSARATPGPAPPPPPDPDGDENAVPEDPEERIRALEAELAEAERQRQDADRKLEKKEKTILANETALNRARDVLATLTDAAEAAAGAEEAASEELENARRRAAEVAKGAGSSKRARE